MTSTRRKSHANSSLVRALSDPPPPPPEAGGPVPPVPALYMRIAVVSAFVLVAAVVALNLDVGPSAASGALAIVSAASTLVVAAIYVQLERKRSEQLEQSSTALRQQVGSALERDWLTGLITADEFWQTARREINRSRRYDRQCSFLVADVDLEGFLASSPHAQNADPSHMARHLADLVRASVRESDTVARRSGVFGVMVLLPETPADGAKVVVERLQQKMNENPVSLLDGNHVPLKLRSVVVSYPGDGEDDEALANALAAGA